MTPYDFSYEIVEDVTSVSTTLSLIFTINSSVLGKENEEITVEFLAPNKIIETEYNSGKLENPEIWSAKLQKSKEDEA